MATGSSNRYGQDTTLVCSEKTRWKKIQEKPQTSAGQDTIKEQFTTMPQHQLKHKEKPAKDEKGVEQYRTKIHTSQHQKKRKTQIWEWKCCQSMKLHKMKTNSREAEQKRNTMWQVKCS